MLALNSWSPGALRELVGVFGAAENLHSIFDREFEPLTFGDSAKHASGAVRNTVNPVLCGIRKC